MTINRLSLHLWAAKKRESNPKALEDHYAVITARRDIRRTIRKNSESRPSGKGNKAWNRVKKSETNFRNSGGFYLSDLIP